MAVPTTGISWGRTTRNSAKDNEPDSHLTKVKEVYDPNSKDENNDVKEVESEVDDSHSMEEEQDSLHDSVQTLKATIEHLTATLSSVDAKFSVQENKLDFLFHKCEALTAQNQHLNERIDYLENQQRLTNLKIDGLKEEQGENLSERVIKLADRY